MNKEIIICLKSIVGVFIFRSHVLRHVGGIHFESVALIKVNSILAVHGSSSGFGVGHAEDIIGLHSSVYTAVTRYRVPKA